MKLSKKQLYIIELLILFIIALISSTILASNFNQLSFYGDDLSEYNNFKETNFFKYIFSSEVRFRPVSNIFIYLEYAICGNNTTAVKIYNIIAFSITACVFGFVVYEISKSRLCTVVTTILFIVSRFSWYNITQVIGQMENICLIVLFFIIFFLYKYDKTRSDKYFYLSLGFYQMILLCHERYFVLIAPLIIFYILKANNLTKKCFFSLCLLLVFTFYSFFKTTILHMNFASDTGGTSNVSINVHNLIIVSFNSFLNVLGIPLSKDYLVGTTFDMMEMWDQNLAIIITIIFSFVFIISIIFIIYDLQKKRFDKALNLELIIIIAIGALIVSVSVSKRVEMRFLFSSYSLLLMLFSCVYRKTKEYVSGIIIAIPRLNYKFRIDLAIACILFGISVLFFSKVMVDGSYPYYYIVQNNNLSNYYYHSIVEANNGIGDKKLVLIIKDSDSKDVFGYDIYKSMNTWLKQYDFRYEIVEYDQNILETLNSYNAEDTIVSFFNSDAGEITTITPEDCSEVITNKWITGNDFTKIMYSNTGRFNLYYYIPDGFEEMKYHIYINDKLIYDSPELRSDVLYLVDYQDEDIYKKYFKIRITCDESYIPAEHGGEDLRELCMFINLFNSNC